MGSDGSGTVVTSSCGGPGYDKVCLLCKKRHDTYQGLLVFGGNGPGFIPTSTMEGGGGGHNGVLCSVLVT
jgi:hypothetical protein